MTWWVSSRTLGSWLPNLLSLLRGVLGLIIPFMLGAPQARWHYLATFLFFIGVFTDYLDGHLARLHNTVSGFGKIIDPTMDKILILGPLAVFAALGLYSPWWVVVIVAREAVVTFCRVGWYLEGRAVGAERLGKWKFAVQTAVVIAGLAFFLCDGAQVPESLPQILKQILFLLLISATILTVLSGVSFFTSNHLHFQSRAFAKFVSACGVGTFPLAPGTWGSLVGALLAWMVSWNLWLHLGVLAGVFWAGKWAVDRLDLSKGEDPGYVVMDEVAGALLTFLGYSMTPARFLAGFILFRAFDIWKPFPIRRLEKFPGFWGIMADDLGAGVYAWLLLGFF